MTVINPKSISGITSITTPSGADDLLTIHNNGGAERFRIDGSGNTRITSGIVTTVSVGAVTSVGAISGDISIADKIIHTGDTNTAIRFPAADTVTVETGGSERIRIDSNGRLLIGETTGDTDIGRYVQVIGQGFSDSGQQYARLAADVHGPGIDFLKSRNATWGSHTIVQNGDNLGNIYFRADDGVNYSGSGAIIRSEIDGTPGSSDLPARIILMTSADGSDQPTERLRINSVGKVGINSTAPDGTLAIEAAAASSPVLTMRNHPAAGVYTNNYGVEYRHAYNAVNHGMLVHSQEASNGRRVLDVSDSNGVFATFTNGKVGIKSDSPAVQLNVTGEARVQASGDSTSYVNIKNNQIYMDANGTGYLDIAHVGGDLQVRTSTSSALDTTGPTFKSNGNLAFASGKGIDFSATSGPDTGATGTSELLDDYEEGSWSALIMDGNSSNTTVSNVVAKYVKVGQMVYCYFNITEADSGKTGTMRFYQLPFTTANSTLQITGTWWLDESSPSAGDAVGGAIYLQHNSNNSGGFVYPTTEWQQANHRYLQFADWASGRPMYGSFTYQTQD